MLDPETASPEPETQPGKKHKPRLISVISLFEKLLYSHDRARTRESALFRGILSQAYIDAIGLGDFECCRGSWCSLDARESLTDWRGQKFLGLMGADPAAFARMVPLMLEIGDRTTRRVRKGPGDPLMASRIHELDLWRFIDKLKRHPDSERILAAACAAVRGDERKAA